jgi:nucleoside-diphosphate-sugar epimerase
MRCVVTGAAGFVGSSLCDELLSRGHEVVGIDAFVDYYPREMKEKNLESAKTHERFSFIEGDLRTCELARLVDGAEWVFHQAAQAGVRASWGGLFQSYCDYNIVATQRLLDALKGSETLKKVVFASSSSVYGNAESFPTSELAVPQPVSPYGVTKLASEHLMSLYCSEFEVPTVSLRYFTVFGPRQRPDMAFHRFCKAAILGEEITVYGDGEQSRDFTFISDIVDANILSAEKGTPGLVANIGGGTQATVNEVLSFLDTHIGTLRVNRVARQAGDARHTKGDTSRAQKELQFSPKVSLYEGLRHEVTWMQRRLEGKE